MDFLNELVNFGSIAVAASGAAVGVTGLKKLSEGRSQHNAGAEEEGMSKLVGGVIIIIIGLELVPQIMTFF